MEQKGVFSHLMQYRKSFCPRSQKSRRADTFKRPRVSTGKSAKGIDQQYFSSSYYY